MNKNTTPTIQPTPNKPHRGREMLEQVLVLDVVDVDGVVVVRGRCVGGVVHAHDGEDVGYVCALHGGFVAEGEEAVFR